MAKGVRKGSDYRNVGETWDKNEREREGSSRSGREDAATGGKSKENDLERAVRESAEEYDDGNLDDKVMGGERASVNDDPNK